MVKKIKLLKAVKINLKKKKQLKAVENCCILVKTKDMAENG